MPRQKGEGGIGKKTRKGRGGRKVTRATNDEDGSPPLFPPRPLLALDHERESPKTENALGRQQLRESNTGRIVLACLQR